MSSPPTTSSRLDSVDALRGLTVAAMLVVNDAGDWHHVHPWLEHAEWHGVTPPDYVFPFFLFIVGVSIALALVPQLERGADRAQLQRKVLWRALRIVLLGLALEAVGQLAFHPSRGFRFFGVLQRIGLCYAAVGVLTLQVRSARVQWGWIAGLLLGYWALLALGGPLTLWDNLHDRIDTALLGRHAYMFDAATGRAHDPEGPLGTLPSIATTLLGLRAGAWLRSRNTRTLLRAGLAMVAAGALWSLVLPLNKNLWTSSFVLWMGGWATLMLLAAHWAVDRHGWPALGRSMGVNAITAYAASWVAICILEGSGVMRPLYATLFARPLAGFEPWVPSAAFALAFTAVFWALMRWFYQRGWRITI